MSLDQWHLRLLSTEISPLMWLYFKYREIPYDLRRDPALFTPPARSSIYSTNSVHFRGSLILNKLPNLIKSSRSISEFKNMIKKIKNIDCGCMIYRRWHTLSQFPGKSCFSLCFFGSCSHQSPDSFTRLFFSIQLAGCYMICKNAENLGIIDIDSGFVTFMFCTPTLSKVIIINNK